MQQYNYAMLLYCTIHLIFILNESPMSNCSRQVSWQVHCGESRFNGICDSPNKTTQTYSGMAFKLLGHDAEHRRHCDCQSELFSNRVGLLQNRLLCSAVYQNARLARHPTESSLITHVHHDTSSHKGEP